MRRDAAGRHTGVNPTEQVRRLPARAALPELAGGRAGDGGVVAPSPRLEGLHGAVR